MSRIASRSTTPNLRFGTLAPLAVVAGCALVPFVLPAFYVTLCGYIGLGVLVALGLVLLTGISGQTSFGQASFVGLAAYATALLSKFAGASPVLGLAAGLALTGGVAWLLGLITARLSGHFLALCSVAWGISFFALFGTLPWLHGFNGIGNIPPLSFAGIAIPDRRINLALILLLAALVFRLSRNLLDSRIGRAIRTLNGARIMGESVGIDTVRLSRAVFVLAALYAALAGWLFAHFQRFINPTPFSLGASIDYLFMVIIGGAEWLWGAVLGAAVITVLRDQLNDWVPWLLGRPGDYEALVFSLVVIIMLHRAPRGLLPLLRRPVRRTVRMAQAGHAITPLHLQPIDSAATPSAGERVLDVENVSRHFGGLAANQDISLSLRCGEIVALIGPNGAGKSTLFDIISGVLAPDAGHIRLFGDTSPAVSPRRVAALGVARTFQHVRLNARRSVQENVALGAHLSGHAGLLRSMLHLERAEEARLIAVARDCAARVGLGDALDTPAGDLPLGRQRLVEIARALCLRPKLLLLDEPAAGLRHQEKQHLYALLSELRAGGIAILLVEHDMDFVMRLADRVVVMDFGQKIAEGIPERVQVDPVVREAYLGGVENPLAPAQRGRGSG